VKNRSLQVQPPWSYMPNLLAKVPYWEVLIAALALQSASHALAIGDFNTCRAYLDEAGAIDATAHYMDAIEQIGYRDLWFVPDVWAMTPSGMREGLRVRGLSAGGNRIRTIGPAPAKGSSGRYQSETAARKAEPLTGSGSKRQCLPGVAAHSFPFAEGPRVRIRLPPPLSRTNLRILLPPNINKASSNRSRRRGYGAAGSGPRPC
jgi:hypothetical protein